jgi:hypothetical protein
MKFGYFTLSDNHYADNRRSPNALIADILDEAAGFDEVILYVNVVLKPHSQAKEDMALLMAEVAPAFAVCA